MAKWHAIDTSEAGYAVDKGLIPKKAIDRYLRPAYGIYGNYSKALDENNDELEISRFANEIEEIEADEKAVEQ